MSVSKSKISYLTKQAKIDLDYDENLAKGDANAIIEHFYEIKKSETLACIYLIDSICRDAGGIFIDEFKNHVLDMMKVSYQSIKQKYVIVSFIVNTDKINVIFISCFSET